MQTLPSHLRKYIVDQDYSKYTALDQAVWRYILRQLKDFLSRHAHESYLDGLVKTGIDIESIPRIEDVSAKLEKFGWRALPVSGFIPPAAFMELQSLSVLPIASDMRSLDHLEYTPAPDIVHEAAGHAPIIADPEYAAYLKQYAQVAKKALISKEDIEIYQAIRELSDLKENPGSIPEQIRSAEEKLTRVSQAVSFTSEASELSRMNWWTAEYGLVGSLQSPKIFGAGLLSSVGESKWCLSEKVRKIPLSLDCIRQSYDITEPQPQLFVARDFKHLSTVLDELSATMAYRIGGTKALERAVQAGSVNTVELDSGIQISGVLKNYLTDSNGQPVYLQFSGPTQLSHAYRQLPGHGTEYHHEGYGTPVGKWKNLQPQDLQPEKQVTVTYTSGVHIEGTVSSVQAVADGYIVSFRDATCRFGETVLFKPEWGNYDIVIGHDISSVYGGPADRIAYGEVDDFVAQRVPTPNYSETQKQMFMRYQSLRDLRKSTNYTTTTISDLFNTWKNEVPNEWLLFVELLEMSHKLNAESPDIKSYLQQLAQKNTPHRNLIEEGIRLADQQL